MSENKKGFLISKAITTIIVAIATIVEHFWK